MKDNFGTPQMSVMVETAGNLTKVVPLVAQLDTALQHHFYKDVIAEWFISQKVVHVTEPCA